VSKRETVVVTKSGRPHVAILSPRRLKMLEEIEAYVSAEDTKRPG
jgi:PHD/YefM family antitoxin component YafN of YafNO toxin-antitoxin module